MNLAKKTHINELFGFYEKLLTDKQQAYLRYYFEDDYSIVEIAEAETVSRQAVSDNINRAIEQLEKYENILSEISVNGAGIYAGNLFKAQTDIGYFV